MKSFFAILVWLAPLAAQELVVNYLGGLRPASTAFDAPVTGPAGIAVTRDGRYLYVTQGARALVLRYDLRERSVLPITVPGLAADLTSITVDNDGTALVPLRGQIARIELDGRITTPGITFPPLNSGMTAVAVIGRLNEGPTRTAIVGGFGTSFDQRRLWLHIPPSTTAQSGAIGTSCNSVFCDNSALPADGPPDRFRANRLWSVAIGLDTPRYPVYFTDDGRGRAEVGSVARIVSGTLTVLGHATLAAIPMGSTGNRLAAPSGLALDASGALIVADTGNHRILRRTAAGVWSVLAGTGGRGSRGDGGPALNAEFFEPRSLSIDASGTLYVHDSGNGFLRRILPNGTLERINVIGTQSETLIQDLVLPDVTAITTGADGQIYVASQARMVEVDARGRATYVAGTGQYGAGGEGVPATEAPIQRTSGMTVDREGRLIWSELYRIRRLELNGTVNTIAGRGEARSVNASGYDPDPVPARSAFLQPTTLWAETDGSLLISDGSLVRRLRDGNISSVTGVRWFTEYADGLPAIFTQPNHRGVGLYAARDGRIVFDGDSTRSLRFVDAEGLVWTQPLPGMRVQSLAPAPDGSTYVLVDRPGLGVSNVSSRLLSVAPNGAITGLSRDLRQPGVNPIRPGQPLSEVSTDFTSGPMASDGRGFLYLWESSQRRLLVVGEVSTVTVDSVPSGQRITVDGVAVETPQLFRWLPGEYHTVEAPAEIGDGVPFSSWTHGAGRSVTWMPPGGNSRVVVRFGTPAAGGN